MPHDDRSNMIRIDDRTQDELATHRWLIVGTDSFLSGWGEAEGGTSVAAWACRPEDRLAVLAWVRSRGDMLRVREVAESGSGARYTPRGNVRHFHVYCVRPGHSALEGAA